MKRTAAAFLMVAGLGGCVSPEKKSATTDPSGPGRFGQASRAKEVPGVVGPNGLPMTAKAGVKPSKTALAKASLPTPAGVPASGVVQASATAPVESLPAAGEAGVQSSPGFSRVIGGTAPADAATTTAGGGCTDGSCAAPAAGHRHPVANAVRAVGGHLHHDGGPGIDPAAYGPTASRLQTLAGHTGPLPVPSMGPYGAVAAVGAYGAAGGPPGAGPMYMNQRTMIRFVSPGGMRITWQAANGTFSDATPLEAPARYNFPQGSVYRLKLTGIANRPGATYYPTLEVYPATPDTIEFLSHAAVPVGLTDEDFDQVRAGNLVVKVVYLPNRTYQDLASVAGGDLGEVVSTRLEPGVDPIVEANRRGTILTVIRIGNIDLQDPNTPPVDAPPGGVRVVPVPVAVPGAVVPAPGLTPPAAPAPMSAPMVAPVAPPITSDATPRTPAILPNAVKGPVTANPVSLPTLPPVR